MNQATLNPTPAPPTLAPGTAGSSDFDLSNAARTDACVLFSGPQEAAERLAYRIHRLSGWRHGPFSVVDCGGPDVEGLLAGATGRDDALRDDGQPQARLTQAGTILLQEVGRLSLESQRRMADWIVGARETGVRGRPRQRLMASSSEPLLQRVLAGTFDDRLFYRLNVIHIVAPRQLTVAQPRQ